MDYYNKKPKPLSIEELQDSQALCIDYCERTDYGKHSCYVGPNGLVTCEGAYCDEAYEKYLKDFYNSEPDTEDELDNLEDLFYKKYGFSRELASIIDNMPDEKKVFLKTFGIDGAVQYLNDYQNIEEFNSRYGPTLNNTSVKRTNSLETVSDSEESLSPMEELFIKYNI